MTGLWRKHLIICLFLGLLAIPVYFMDLASMPDRGGSGWIALDFRGLIFWTYAILIIFHIVLSSIVLVSHPTSGVLRIHFLSMLLSILLLVAGFVIYGKLLRAKTYSA